MKKNDSIWEIHSLFILVHIAIYTIGLFFICNIYLHYILSLIIAFCFIWMMLWIHFNYLYILNEKIIIIYPFRLYRRRYELNYFEIQNIIYISPKRSMPKLKILTNSDDKYLFFFDVKNKTRDAVLNFFESKGIKVIKK